MIITTWLGLYLFSGGWIFRGRYSFTVKNCKQMNLNLCDSRQIPFLTSCFIFFFGSYALLVSGKWRIESWNDFIELYLSLSSWYISMNLKDFFSFFFMLKPSRPENFSGIQFCSKLIIQTTNLHHTFVKEDTCRRGSILSFERELVREDSYHKSCKYLMNDKSSCSFTTSMYIFICMYEN